MKESFLPNNFIPSLHLLYRSVPLGGLAGSAGHLGWCKTASVHGSHWLVSSLSPAAVSRASGAHDAQPHEQEGHKQQNEMTPAIYHPGLISEGVTLSMQCGTAIGTSVLRVRLACNLSLTRSLPLLLLILLPSGR